MQYTIRSDKQFYNQFQSLQNKLKELSYLFQIQDKPLEASDLEIIEWHNIATKLQKELAQLIIEAQFRISLKL